ncbi:MAG: alpha/beta fold hydrolase [Saprospiraceae bacterium]
MDFIKFKNKKIAYQTSGSRQGVPIILVHGFCEDSRVWNEFKPDLEEEHPVVCIDLPGFGASEVVDDISIADMAEAVHIVIKTLNLEQFIYIGHSMGGYVGAAFAKKYGEQLLGLVMFHSHPFADSEEKKVARQRVIDFIGRQGHVLYAKQLFPNLFAAGYARSNAFLMEKLTFRAISYPAAGIVNALQAMRNRPDNSSALTTLRCPVLFIIGEEDSVIDMENSIAQTHLPNIADIQVLPKVGHMGMFEARKKCSIIIRQFVPFCAKMANVVNV